MKNPLSLRNSGAYTSPGTPNYGDNNMAGTPKNWHSERVPLPSNSGRRHIGAAAMIPFNSGRALPSKWDDAERWITSPVSGFGVCKSPIGQSPRRSKSKSGPQGLAYFSTYSPTVAALEGGNMRNFTPNSPLTTGALVPDGFHIHYDTGNAGRSNSFYAGHSHSWSTGGPFLSDLLSETSFPSSQDSKIVRIRDEEALVSRVVSRRDMATQMSPDQSSRSSSKGRLSFSVVPSAMATLMIPDNDSEAKDEIRDVQVDKGNATARHYKKQGRRKLDLTNAHELASPWAVEEASRNKLSALCRLQREEAKITAWENLQKAKAEAAIQKLEMMLEKKRSKSMDKILNKLRAAQVKARTMRNTPSEYHAKQAHSRCKWILSVTNASLCNCIICGRN